MLNWAELVADACMYVSYVIQEPGATGWSVLHSGGPSLSTAVTGQAAYYNLPCTASLANHQPARPRDQWTDPRRSPSGCS